jgi:hypothetical protein
MIDKFAEFGADPPRGESLGVLDAAREALMENAWILASIRRRHSPISRRIARQPR